MTIINIGELKFTVAEECFVEFGYDAERLMGEYDYNYRGLDIWVILNDRAIKARRYINEDSIYFSFLDDIEMFFKNQSIRTEMFNFLKKRYGIEKIYYFTRDRKRIEE